MRDVKHSQGESEAPDRAHPSRRRKCLKQPFLACTKGAEKMMRLHHANEKKAGKRGAKSRADFHPPDQTIHVQLQQTIDTGAGNTQA